MPLRCPNGDGSVRKRRSRQRWGCRVSAPFLLPDWRDGGEFQGCQAAFAMPKCHGMVHGRRSCRKIGAEVRREGGRSACNAGIAVLRGRVTGGKRLSHAVRHAQPRGVRRRRAEYVESVTRSVQQEQGIKRRRVRRKLHVKGANGATSIGGAWGVRTRARVCGQERQNERYERRGMGAGEPGGREPPRRLSGGECGGADGSRAKPAAGGDGRGVRSGADTSAWRDAGAGVGGARAGGGKQEERTGPTEGGRPMSPSGAGEARSGSSATWAVAGGPCRRARATRWTALKRGEWTMRG